MLSTIRRLPNGARFYLVDLHCHTPADQSFNCGPYPVETEEQKQAFAKEYVRFVRNIQHVEIIGITDHNNVSWLPYIQAAAENEGVVVFPGVELGALAGQNTIHFLALFNPGTLSKDIDHFISSLGLMPGNRFHADGTPRVVQKHTYELTQCIVQISDGLPGIVIACHASSKNGLFYGMQGEGRVISYTDKNLLAVEIPDQRSALSDFERRLVDGELDAYSNRRIACLNHSDGRGLTAVPPGRQSVGSRKTLVKLSSMSIEGLRQAFIDFDSRLRLEGEWREERYPRLIGIVAEGGFLAAKSQAETETTTRSGPFMLHLNPNLNTIIGGRGSGKSALLELIRYAFALPAKTKANEKQAGDILRATFPTGAKVVVYYELADGTIYQIERISGSSPRVFEAVSGEERIGLHPASILLGGNPIEAYGQKEIYEISKDATFQLRLIDNYIAEDLKPILENERLILRDLEALAIEAARLRSEIEDKEQQIRDLPGIEEELRRLELDQAIVRLQMKKQLDAEKRLLDGAQQAVNTLLQDIDQFRRQHSGLAQIMNQEVREGMPHADILAAQAMLLTEIDDKLNSGLSNITETVSSTWERGATGRATWQSAYDAEEEHYAALLREFQDLSADRYISLQALRAKLKQQNEELEDERRKLRDLCQTRCQRLLDLRALRRDCEFSLRSQKAQELSNRLGDMMTVAVIREGNRDAYAEYLADFFAGSGIARSVVDSIVNSRISKEYTDPIQLVEAIRLEQTSPSDTNSALNQIFNISQAYRRRLAQLSEDVLAKLETYRVPDLPDIRLKVGDNYRSLITPLGQPGLSTGQKCTAVLSLILIEQRTPLLIDQPEDDLDNQFIFDEIVTTLRREKERRQFIVATHNANIPVSGDAELIIIMNADEQHGWIDCFGSIDDSQLRTPIETVLEGGEKAFQIRKEKYGI